METKEKTAEDLKAYSDACDDKPEYLFVCEYFTRWEHFTFSGLNECPHRFRPAIAMLAADYASSVASLKVEKFIKTIEDHQKLPDTDTSGFWALERLKEALTN